MLRFRFWTPHLVLFAIAYSHLTQKMAVPIQSLNSHKRSEVVRRQPCLSAIWEDSLSRRECRRAVYSWSIGYGTLCKQDTSPGTLAGNGDLDERGRQLLSSIAAPHVSSQAAGRWPRGRIELPTMPGLKSLVGKWVLCIHSFIHLVPDLVRTTVAFSRVLIEFKKRSGKVFCHLHLSLKTYFIKYC